MRKIKKSSIADRSENKIVLYADKEGNVELRADIEKDTLWANQIQIGKLFGVDVRTISEHLTNIFKTAELVENSVIRKFRITAKDGKIYRVKFYNLDAIIAVGYRVNSKKATQFRIWATKILHEYLVAGYTLNKRTLTASDEKMVGLDEAVKFMESEALAGPLNGKVTLKLTRHVRSM